MGHLLEHNLWMCKTLETLISTKTHTMIHLMSGRSVTSSWSFGIHTNHIRSISDWVLGIRVGKLWWIRYESWQLGSNIIDNKSAHASILYEFCKRRNDFHVINQEIKVPLLLLTIRTKQLSVVFCSLVAHLNTIVEMNLEDHGWSH